LTLAFAVSIALHEILAGAIAPNRPEAPAREIVSSARLVRIALRPTPSPKAELAPQRTVTPAPVRALPPPVHIAPVARVAARTPPRAQVHRAAVRFARNARPVWETPIGVTANGVVAAAAAGAGAGAGSRGNGNAPGSGELPCGFVTFSDPHGSHFDTQTRGFWVDIRMSVHFADGSSQSVLLDYPWYYPSEATNPWSDQNLKDPSFPTRFQPPPADKASSEPPLVQYVVTHSTPDGMTLLKDCP
jgi:hypothetical protein